MPALRIPVTYGGPPWGPEAPHAINPPWVTGGPLHHPPGALRHILRAAGGVTHASKNSGGGLRLTVPASCAGQEFLPNDLPTPPIDGRTLGPA
jgi:hypothetical protein